MEEAIKSDPEVAKQVLQFGKKTKEVLRFMLKTATLPLSAVGEWAIMEKTPIGPFVHFLLKCTMGRYYEPQTRSLKDYFRDGWRNNRKRLAAGYKLI